MKNNKYISSIIYQILSTPDDALKNSNLFFY